MTDTPDVLPIDGTADALAARIIPPEQPPMDDAAGGPTVDAGDDEMGATVTDDLSVQGGE